MSSTRFLVISGTSGSGKSIALQVLEDLGFYCIDNLPASLIPEMASRLLDSPDEGNKCAVSIDSRNQDFIGELKAHFDSLGDLGIDHRVLFLDADDSTLLTRYSETRRKHPLSDQNTSLQEAIAKERKLLEHLSDVADRHVNTSKTTPHELRSIIRSFAATSDEKALTLLFQSFGFKYGPPTDVDFVFDVRCLPNPYWHSELRHLTGQDDAIIKFLSSRSECSQMYQQIRDFIEYWLPHFIADNRNYITVGIGCTGGKHRSVYIAELLRDFFSQTLDSSDAKIQTQIRHRELSH